MENRGKCKIRYLHSKIRPVNENVSKCYLDPVTYHEYKDQRESSDDSKDTNCILKEIFSSEIFLNPICREIRTSSWARPDQTTIQDIPSETNFDFEKAFRNLDEYVKPYYKLPIEEEVELERTQYVTEPTKIDDPAYSREVYPANVEVYNKKENAIDDVADDSHYHINIQCGDTEDGSANTSGINKHILINKDPRNPMKFKIILKPENEGSYFCAPGCSCKHCAQKGQKILIDKVTSNCNPNVCEKAIRMAMDQLETETQYDPNQGQTNPNKHTGPVNNQNNKFRDQSSCTPEKTRTVIIGRNPQRVTQKNRSHDWHGNIGTFIATEDSARKKRKQLFPCTSTGSIRDKKKAHENAVKCISHYLKKKNEKISRKFNRMGIGNEKVFSDISLSSDDDSEENYSLQSESSIGEGKHINSTCTLKQKNLFGKPSICHFSQIIEKENRSSQYEPEQFKSQCGIQLLSCESVVNRPEGTNAHADLIKDISDYLQQKKDKIVRQLVKMGIEEDESITSSSCESDNDEQTNTTCKENYKNYGVKEKQSAVHCSKIARSEHRSSQYESEQKNQDRGVQVHKNMNNKLIGDEGKLTQTKCTQKNQFNSNKNEFMQNESLSTRCPNCKPQITENYELRQKDKTQRYELNDSILKKHKRSHCQQPTRCRTCNQQQDTEISFDHQTDIKGGCQAQKKITFLDRETSPIKQLDAMETFKCPNHSSMRSKQQYVCFSDSETHHKKRTFCSSSSGSLSLDDLQKTINTLFKSEDGDDLKRNKYNYNSQNVNASKRIQSTVAQDIKSSQTKNQICNTNSTNSQIFNIKPAYLHSCVQLASNHHETESSSNGCIVKCPECRKQIKNLILKDPKCLSPPISSEESLKIKIDEKFLKNGHINKREKLFPKDQKVACASNSSDDVIKCKTVKVHTKACKKRKKKLRKQRKRLLSNKSTNKECRDSKTKDLQGKHGVNKKKKELRAEVIISDNSLNDVSFNFNLDRSKTRKSIDMNDATGKYRDELEELQKLKEYLTLKKYFHKWLREENDKNYKQLRKSIIQFHASENNTILGDKQSRDKINFISPNLTVDETTTNDINLHNSSSECSLNDYVPCLKLIMKDNKNQNTQRKKKIETRSVASLAKNNINNFDKSVGISNMIPCHCSHEHHQSHTVEKYSPFQIVVRNLIRRGMCAMKRFYRIYQRSETNLCESYKL